MAQYSESVYVYHIVNIECLTSWEAPTFMLSTKLPSYPSIPCVLLTIWEASTFMFKNQYIKYQTPAPPPPPPPDKSSWLPSYHYWRVAWPRWRIAGAWPPGQQWNPQVLLWLPQAGSWAARSAWLVPVPTDCQVSCHSAAVKQLQSLSCRVCLTGQNTHFVEVHYGWQS